MLIRCSSNSVGALAIWVMVPTQLSGVWFVVPSLAFSSVLGEDPAFFSGITLFGTSGVTVAALKAFDSILSLSSVWISVQFVVIRTSVSVVWVYIMTAICVAAGAASYAVMVQDEAPVLTRIHGWCDFLSF